MAGLFGGGGGTIQSTTPIISSLRLQTSCFGRPVPWVFGATRVTPNLIQYEDYTPIEHTTEQSSGGKGGGGGSVKSTNYTYEVALVLAMCSGPIAGIGKVWVDKDLTDLGKLKLDLYTGTATQQPYPYLTAKHPDRAIAYRGLAYVASGAYDLGTSGSVGNHSMEVQMAGAVSALVPDANPKDVITALLTDADQGIGLPSAAIGDLTNFSNFCLANGVWISPAYTEQKPAYEHIRNLLQIGFADCVYSDGKLKVVPYSDAAASRAEGTFTPDVAPVYALTEDDFLDADSPIHITRKSLNESYNHVQVKFTDRANDYNDGIAESKDQADIDLLGLRTMNPVSFPEVCDATTAQKVADFLLHRSLHVRNEYEFRLPWKYVLIEPMDVLQLEYPRLNIASTMVLVTEVSEDDQGTITVKAEEYPLGTNRNTLKVPPPIDPFKPGWGADPGNATVPVMFEPPLSLTANDPQVFIAASGGPNWGGAEVWVSTDHISYQRVGKITAPARYGVLTQPLLVGPAQDSLNVLSVFLAGKSATLTNTSAENAQAGVTACFVDGEYLSYTQAHLSAQNAYDLSGLVRGSYGSASKAHAVGAPFVRLDGAPFAYSYPVEWKDKTIWVKLVSFNVYGGALQDVSAVPEYQHTITGAVVGAVQGLTVTVEDDGVHARWGAPASVNGGDWSATELRKGTDWASAASLVVARTTHYPLGWLPVGALLVWAQHRNTVGGVSTPVSAGLSVLAPAVPDVTAAVDMTVIKLVWPDCKTTQPIDHYVIRRGGQWVDATPIGKVNALMITLLEVSEGTHKYWVAAVDKGGNVGEAGSVTVTVESPISAILHELNSGLTDTIQGINDLGTQVGTINTAVFDPSTGLLADAEAQAIWNAATAHDVAVAHQQITALAQSASASTELLATRLAQQHSDEAGSANTLGGLLQGKKDKTQAANQLALAKTQLQASVDQLGVSTASSLTLLSAQVGQNRADFENEVTLRTTADQTEATARQALATKQTTDHGTAMAAVTAEQSARTSAIASEASARQTLAAKQQTDHDTSQAAITNEQTLRVAADQAAASNLTSVQASLNGQMAGIAQRLAVVVDANGNVIAAYTLALNTNGRVVGMRLDNNGTVGNFVVQADKFAFVPAGSNTEIPVFVAGVVNGVNTFGINGQLVVDGSIYARSLNVTRLSALTANLGNVTAGTMRMDSDGSGDWGLIASGTKGFDDGVNGYWLGKHPSGQSAVDLKAGTARLKLSSWGDNLLEFPGFRATPSGLTIDQVDVIKTLNIRGGSVIAPLSTTGHPNQSYGANSFALAVASGYQSLAANTYVSATVNARVGATGPCNCRVGAYLYGANGALVTIFDQDTSVASGTASTPAFSGGVLVPYEQYWCVAVWVGNSYTSGSLYVSDITLNAFGGQK